MEKIEILNKASSGMIVYSKAGRDKGGVFIVLTIEGEYVYLSDGKTRSLQKPKKKKLKHIMTVKYKDEYIAETLAKKGAAALDDAAVKKAIEKYLRRGELI